MYDPSQKIIGPIVPGDYVMQINGVFQNGQVISSPYAGKNVDISFTGSDPNAVVWRLVAGSFPSVTGVTWYGWWIFRTDMPCGWDASKPPHPGVNCQCWTVPESGGMSFWNTDGAAAVPQDYELFQFNPLSDQHYAVYNARASQGRTLVMQYDGHHFSFGEGAPSLITVSLVPVASRIERATPTKA